MAEIDNNLIKSVDCVLINEGQFFGDLVEFVERWCDEYKKDITVSGLDGDYKREKFGQILDLIPLADSVEKLPVLFAQYVKMGHSLFLHAE